MQHAKMGRASMGASMCIATLLSPASRSSRIRNRLWAAALGGLFLTGIANAPAHAQSDAVRATNAAIQSAIQSELQIIRDQIQSRRRLGLAPGGRPIGFSGDPYFRETYFEDAYEAFGALGYAKER